MYQHDVAMIMEREAGLPEYAAPVAVGFCLYPQADGKETARLGRPFFRDQEYVRIVTPGERNTVFFQPATDLHKKRFPKAYAAFKAGTVHAEQGTPLEHWPLMTRGSVMSFKAIGVHTVDALAAVHDGNIEALGTGGRELREKARAFLKQAEDSAAVQKLAAEKQAMADQMRAMQAQIADLASRLEVAEGDKAPTVPLQGGPKSVVGAATRAARQRALREAAEVEQ
jgi:hypothetical protein